MTSEIRSPGGNAVPDVDTQREIYRRMALIKQNDERVHKVVKSGRLIMPYYSARGQEVIPAALSVLVA